MAAETHVLADATDMAILVEHDLQMILGKKLAITLLTDSKSLFDVLSKGTTTTEKRLMIDIEATRQAYDEEVINNLGWIRREYNIADSLTKIQINSIMKKFMLTGKIDLVVEQYVVRTPHSHQVSSEPVVDANVVNSS